MRRAFPLALALLSTALAASAAPTFTVRLPSSPDAPADAAVESRVVDEAGLQAAMGEEAWGVILEDPSLLALLGSAAYKDAGSVFLERQRIEIGGESHWRLVLRMVAPPPERTWQAFVLPVSPGSGRGGDLTSPGFLCQV